MQYIGETKRHLSDRFGEHRRAIEKAIQRHHINQPTAVSDHFSLPGHSINNIELIPAPRTDKIEQRRYSESKRSVVDFQGQDS